MPEDETIVLGKLQAEIRENFENGEITKASDENLQKYLMSLATEHVCNEFVRHREVIRALTINHIQMKRHIDNLNAQSNKTQKWVMTLAIAALIGTIV